MNGTVKNTSPDRNFILQQGLPEPAGPSCGKLSSALLFQPRIVGLTALVGIVWQIAALFAALAAVLWWSALLPRFNPFDFVYNHTLGRRSGAPRLGPAPPPRRFAQGMAASFTTAIAASLFWHAPVAAYVLEGFLVVALGALLLGRLCLGSFLFYLFTGRRAFAVRTLPWGRGG